MTDARYPVEILHYNEDDGTMPERIETLAEHVVGRRIVDVIKEDQVPNRYSWAGFSDGGDDTGAGQRQAGDAGGQRRLLRVH